MKSESRITKELSKITNEPVEGVTVLPVDQIDKWTVQIQGPPGTPYEGGVFNVNVVFPKEYPIKPPEIAFNPPLYHPNVNQTNGIPDLSLLSANYKPTILMTTIFKEIVRLLANPDGNHAEEAEIGELLATNRDEFNRRATEFTRSYRH